MAHPLSFSLIVHDADYGHSYRGLLHRRRTGSPRRPQGCTQLRNRLCLPAGRHRGRRHRLPEDDGREYQIRHPTTTAPTAIRRPRRPGPRIDPLFDCTSQRAPNLPSQLFSSSSKISTDGVDHVFIPHLGSGKLPYCVCIAGIGVLYVYVDGIVCQDIRYDDVRSKSGQRFFFSCS